MNVLSAEDIINEVCKRHQCKCKNCKCKQDNKTKTTSKCDCKNQVLER